MRRLATLTTVSPVHQNRVRFMLERHWACPEPKDCQALVLIPEIAV